MSRRRGAAIPLITLIVSFGVVLVGGVLGRPDSPGATPPTSAPSQAPSPVVRFTLDGLHAGDVLNPFPGLRVAVSQPAKPAKGSGKGDPTTVEICISPVPDWAPVGDGWNRKRRGDGTDALCRTGTVKAGTVDSIDIRLEQR